MRLTKYPEWEFIFNKDGSVVAVLDYNVMPFRYPLEYLSVPGKMLTISGVRNPKSARLCIYGYAKRRGWKVVVKVFDREGYVEARRYEQLVLPEGSIPKLTAD
mgnify:CR=1 FL=1